MSECPEKLWEWGVWPLGGEVMGFWKADGGWYWDGGKGGGAFAGAEKDLIVAAGSAGMRFFTFGGKMGSSGWRMVATRSRLTTFACGRVEKYARFYIVLVSRKSA